MRDKKPAKEYRKAMLVTHYRRYKDGEVYPECPECGTPTITDYQKHCATCGQKLKWCYTKMKCSKDYSKS